MISSGSKCLTCCRSGVSEYLNHGHGLARIPQPLAKELMSILTIELPDSLRKSIEALAAKEGYTVNQFLVSAAGEKLAVSLTLDYLRREAAAGRREDFEKYLAAVPDVAPADGDGL
jgi:hypothetical protein